MELYLTKVAALFSYPLGLALLILLLTFFLLFRYVGFGLLLLLLTIGGLWAVSTPLVAHHLRASLETRYPPLPMEVVPRADAIVVLGGAIDPPTPPLIAPDYRDGVDRVIYAARLFRAGKAPRVVVTGGSYPWLEGAQPEAESVRDLLVELGVPASAILLEPGSLDTHENALFTHQLLQEKGIGPVLLVTSASHMPRALAAFRAVGVAVEPAPTDFWARPDRSTGVLDYLPDAGSLLQSTIACKEYVGLVYYRLRGWVP